MALKGTTSTVSTNLGAYSIYITWSATQSISGNYSDVTAILYMKTNSYGYIPYSTPDNGYIIIDGSQYNFSNPPNIGYSQTKEMFRATKRVYHSDSGSKTLNIGGRYQKAGGSVNFTLTIPSQNFTLDTIPRYANITSFTIDSITATQFRFNYRADRTVDLVQYSLNGGSWTSQPTGNIITGRSPNTSYTIKIRVRSAASGLWTESNTLTVRTVALSSVPSSASFNLESNLSVTISRSSGSMVHDVYLEAYYDSAWRNVDLTTIRTNIGTSTTLTPTTAALNTLFGKHPNTKSVSVRLRIVCRWGSGGTVQGTVYKTGTATIVNANPSIASVSYADVNSTIQAILGNNQKILRNRSSLRVTAGTATSQKGATLRTYRVTIGGNEYNVSANGSTSESGKVINVGTVNQSASQTAVLTVIDSRGNTASRSFTVQMLNYVAPQFLQASADRLNNYEEPTTMNIQARRSIIKPSTVDVNEIYIRYRIKQNPSGSYGSYINLTRNNTNVSGLYQNIEVSQYMNDYPNNRSYTVELGISDKFTGWDTILVTLTEGIALLRLLQNQIQAGVPIVDQETGQPYIYFAESEEW